MFYNTVIIGGGPSCIALAEIFWHMVINSSFWTKEALIVVMKTSHDVLNGFGGASLYSDGKVSFKPAGTRVWELNDPMLVKKGLEFTLNKFQVDPNLSTEILEHLNRPEDFDPSIENTWLFKPYKSVYVDIDKRMEIMTTSHDLLKSCYKPNVIVYKISNSSDVCKYSSSIIKSMTIT